MSSGHERALRWREHLRVWATSGTSRDAYCDWHGLSRSTFYRWEQRLRGELPRLRTQAALASMEWIAVSMPRDADTPRQSGSRRSGGC